MKKITAILCLFLTSCFTGIYIPRLTPYDVADKQNYLGDVGDFEKIRFMEDDHILVSAAFYSHNSNKTNSYSVAVRVPSKYNLMQDVRISSKHFGKFPVEKKTKNVYGKNLDEVRFNLDMSKITRKSELDSVYADTLNLTIGSEITYQFGKGIMNNKVLPSLNSLH
jgi:hypothetical protein